jgi:PTH1 family peptidyl-tRNA hydrolase
MKMIVGLGNPGQKYQLTRHNIGFMVVDALAREFCQGAFKSEHKAQTSKMRLGSKQALLVKPQTYMNLSGESVLALTKYYSIDLDDLVVVHDEVDQAFGSLVYQTNRGHGGHNGIRNIHQLLGRKDYDRLRLGVGRPSHSGQAVADYVLQNFSKQEMTLLPELLELAAESLCHYIQEGFEKTATKFNRKAPL